MSDNSLSEDEFESRLSSLPSNGTNGKADSLKNKTSTPMRTFTKYQPKSYLNISNVVEEPEDDDENVYTDIDNNPVSNTSKVQHKYWSDEIIEENSKLFQDLTKSREECVQTNKNNNALQNKVDQLNLTNETNLSTINRLKAKINALECELKTEKKEKQTLEKKTTILESQVGSLEYQLAEMDKGEHLTKANEVQKSIVLNLKEKHAAETTQLQAKIDEMTTRLEEKDKMIEAQNSIIQMYQQEYSEEAVNKMFEQKLRSAREVLTQKHQETSERQMELFKKEINNQFNQTIIQLREEWESRLEADIGKIVAWLNRAGSAEDVSNLPRVNIKLEALLSMYQQFRSAISKDISELNEHTNKLKAARQELHDALHEQNNEHHETNISLANNEPNQSQLIKELNLAKEQVEDLTQMLVKHKKTIRSLRKASEAQIEQLKNEFVFIIQRVNESISKQNNK